MKSLSKTFSSLFFVLFMFSCDSMPISFTESHSWRITEESEAKGTIKLINVTAYRSGSRDSLEKEAAVLAPLYFWTKCYRTVESGSPADYAVEINLREREFASGWSTKKSLAVEVRIWSCVDGDMRLEESPERLPVAAGRVISTGNNSFSSSKTTGRMLSRAVSAAVRQLPSAQRDYSLSEKEH
jgi:hypothetical protein